MCPAICIFINSRCSQLIAKHRHHRHRYKKEALGYPASRALRNQLVLPWYWPIISEGSESRIQTDYGLKTLKSGTCTGQAQICPLTLSPKPHSLVALVVASTPHQLLKGILMMKRAQEDVLLSMQTPHLTFYVNTASLDLVPSEIFTTFGYYFIVAALEHSA